MEPKWNLNWLKPSSINSLLILIILISYHGQGVNLTVAQELEGETTTEIVSDETTVGYSEIISEIPVAFPYQVLQKCSPEVLEDYLNIPVRLQAHSASYNSHRLAYFQNKYGKSSLYNFTLVSNDIDANLDLDSGPRNFKTACKPSTIQVIDINGTKLLSREDDLQLSFNGGLNANGEWFVFNPDGFLIRNRGQREITYDPRNFCISRVDTTHFWVRLCKTGCSMDDEKDGSSYEESRDGLCIQKCCRFGYVYQMGPSGDLSCVPVNDKDWTIPQGIPQFQLNNPVTNSWSCSAARFYMQGNGLRISPDGKIYRRDSLTCRDWELFDLGGVSKSKWNEPSGSPEKFCMDGLWKINANSTTSYDPDDAGAGHILAFCEHSPEFIVPEFYPKVQFCVYLFALIIHLCTISVYLAFWSQHNIHGWTIFAFCLAQFLLEFLECFVRIFIVFQNEEYQQLGTCRLKNLCIALGVLQQFLLIMCFSWTTVLAFDIFSKIRSMKAASSGKGWTRFGFYSLFGFGIPLIWSVVAVIVEFNSEEYDMVVRPNFAATCFMDKALAVYLYMTLPISLLALVNLIFTFFTVKFVWDAKKNMSSMMKKDSASTKDSNSVKLIVKLCMMMGLFLIFHVLYSFGNPVVRISSYLVFLELYWILQAAATFWIFVLNKRTMKQLGEVSPLIAHLMKLRAANTSNASNTSRATQTSVYEHENPSKSN